MASFILGTKQNPLTVIRLIDGQEAIQEFTKTDDYVKNMSEFDLQSRLKSTKPVTTQQYLDFISQQIVSWEQKYIDAIDEIIIGLNTNSLDILNLCTFPKEIVIIITNGNDECGLPYCRNNNAIILPVTRLKFYEINGLFELLDGNSWEKTVQHELFHIISRNNIPMRNKLYESIGFHLIPDNKYAVLSDKLNDLRITNPDAPLTYHYIKLHTNSSQDKELCLAPVLIASEKYDLTKHEKFFAYLLTRFAILDENTWTVKDLISYDDMDKTEFYKKIGKNTNYILHPEEILADNFVLLLKHESYVASPQILELMKNVLRGK